jgi:hypothetical protein
VPEGRLVYFHNHGDPGPGVYLPKEWRYNRAQFQGKGQTIDDPGLVRHLQPLPPEGFYRVTESFHCCEKQCRLFEQDALLQLGYNADAALETLGNVRQLQVPVTKRDTLPPQ